MARLCRRGEGARLCRNASAEGGAGPETACLLCMLWREGLPLGCARQGAVPTACAVRAAQVEEEFSLDDIMNEEL